MRLSSRAHNLYEAFSQPGCAVCRLTLDSVHHYLDGVIYEYVNKPATHHAVRASRGFCARHAWHIQDHLNASALGVAVLYEGIVRNLLKDMGSISPGGGRRQVGGAASTLEARGLCPACEHQATTENHLLRNLLEHIDQPEFAAGFEQSAGLCLPHLRQALEIPGLHSAKARLLASQQTIWSRLQADLAEFMRKYDYNYANEDITEDEGTSPRRAIEGFSGLKGIR
jgi:hypothetical protein